MELGICEDQTSEVQFIILLIKILKFSSDSITIQREKTVDRRCQSLKQFLKF
ncbi:MAG: hypothetical protein Ct9H90mP20_2890 [Candidatus Neomarinimicrobiota bacterium]|nr:MAG: hypothetical protein Ct9H90mP20_2890 [Candidatus Neomarinimicrobiota bacterium]